MTRKTRFILFIISICLFLVISYGVVLYALGYQYDTTLRTFLKTGAFQIESNFDGDVYVNNSFAGKTSFLNSKFSMARLLPRSYAVRLEREDFQTWTKDIRIESGRYAEYPRVVLIANEPKVESFASVSLNTILTMGFANDKLIVRGTRQAIAFDNKTASASFLPLVVADQRIASASTRIAPDRQKEIVLTPSTISIRWLTDASYQPYRNAGEQVVILKTTQKINQVLWYRDSNHLLVLSGDRLQLVEIDTRGVPNIVNFINITSPFAYDGEKNIVYFIVGKNIKRLHL